VSIKNNLTFDVVIVTRNRTDALDMTIPLILRQNRQPVNFIVVDSSDDHEPIKALVEKLTKDWSGKVVIDHTDKPSITRQRNIGLKYVTSDVVIFPDDDSLWFPDVAENFMKPYEADVEGVVGAVGGKPVQESPINIDDLSYGINKKTVFKDKIQRTRNFIEEKIFPKPFNVYGEDIYKNKTLPDWAPALNCVLVPNISGFRMSFRTSVIKELGFDEVMGSRVGYATHEDQEASIHVIKSGYLVLGARDARVFHHRHPAPRAPAFNYGFFWLTNYMYVIRKHMDPSVRAWGLTRRYLFYKLNLYRLVNGSVFNGAKAAWNGAKAIMDCKVDDLPQVYIEVCDEFMDK